MKKILLVSACEFKQRDVRTAISKTDDRILTIAPTVLDATVTLKDSTWDTVFWDYFLPDGNTINLIMLNGVDHDANWMIAFSDSPLYRKLQRDLGCHFELDPSTNPAILEKLIIEYSSR